VSKCPKCGNGLIDVCPICHQPVDVYSRIVGYMRPITTWNPGKLAELDDRVNYTFWKDDKIEPDKTD
jgi:anaerobic ribonucleoside-triphosphate reductase